MDEPLQQGDADAAEGNALAAGGSASQGEGKDFALEIAPHGLEVLLTCALPEDGVDELASRIRRELMNLGVQMPGEPGWLAGWLREHFARGPQIEKGRLLEGTLPTAPVDGTIDWHQDFFADGFVEDEFTGVVDYRSRAAQRSVVADQLIARIVPPQPGVAGTDVFGRPIPPVAPLVPYIVPARNIRIDEQDGGYYATAAGRVSWLPKSEGMDVAGGTLAVDEVYTIPGSVNLETGNVSHRGALVVGQDIEEGATVEADGDIEVGGVVEPCTIRAGGDLIVHGGLAGGHQRRIVAAGGVRAMYILDADVEAGADVVVQREIRHSTVRTRGAVSMPEGHVVGGTVMALAGITVGYAGTDAVVATTLVAGRDYRLEQQLEQKQQELERLEETRKKIQMAVKPFVPRIRSLSADTRQHIAKLLQEHAALDESIGRLHQEMEEMKAVMGESAGACICVRSRIYPETTLIVGKERLKIESVIGGPIVARTSSDGIQLSPGKL